MQEEVARAAAPTPHLLPTCTTLLVSPSALVYANNIEAVLLKIGLHSSHMGLGLIDHLLRNTATLAEEDDQGEEAHGVWGSREGGGNVELSCWSSFMVSVV